MAGDEPRDVDGGVMGKEGGSQAAAGDLCGDEQPRGLDLPWIDFAWFFPRGQHKLRTPPWSVLHGSLLAAGGSVKWADKKELAIHTGNVGSPWRKVSSWRWPRRRPTRSS